MSIENLPQRSVDTIRTLSIDAIQKANSGHPGLPMGAAPMAYALWHSHLRHSPANPSWPDRDRFVLSPGHGSMLLYALLHLTGYDLPLDQLKAFRQWQSKTPGHPEFGHTAGVESTTGPLGQGSANVVGMAMAERYLAHRYNRPGHEIVDHHSFALVSDGDLMEGLSAEAASLAGHLGLGKVICLYDANDVTLDGPTELSFSGEDVCTRYQSYGWQVLRIEDGDHDVAGLAAAIAEAKAETARPTLIWVHTTIGFGSPNKAGKASSHGSPLGADEVAATKQQLGCDPEAHFEVPLEVAEHMSAIDRGGELEQAWNQKFASYREAFPELAAEWDARIAGDLPSGWDAELPSFPAGGSMATRAAGGKVLNHIASTVPWLLGGDADLGCSTKTLIADGGDFEGTHGSGRNVHFGVREHAMGAICNGMQYHGGMRSYCSTFFVFSDYMRPAVRLAALNKLPVVYVWTHDSICVGEDGPTHQPIEHIMSLRAMPNLSVVRPADANETAEAWRYAMNRSDGPTALVLSRQNLPTFDRNEVGAAEGLHRGAYVLRDVLPSAGTTEISAILIATGSEVSLAIEAQAAMAESGIATRVVSMPCWEQFVAQDQSYRDQVLPPSISARVAIEAGVSFGWERWVGDRGAIIGVDGYGASAPGDVLLEKYGFTVAHVVETVNRVL